MRLRLKKGNRAIKPISIFLFFFMSLSNAIFINVSAVGAIGTASGVSGSIGLGSGNYLKSSDSSDFTMGSGDFTFETWVYASGLPSTSYTGIISIGMPSDLTSGVNGHEIRIGQSFAGDNKLGFLAPNSASNADVWTPTSSSLTLGVWTHLALVRNGSVLTLYVNGVSAATRTGVDFTHTGYPTKSNIGAFFVSKNGGWTDGEFLGSVADIRLVKGTAVYTGNFTPPTSDLQIVNGTNTKLLINSNYSSSNTVADFALNSATAGIQLTAGGSPTSSNTSPYAPTDWAMGLSRNSSMHAYSNSTTAPLMNLSTYTVEGWIKPTASCIGAGIRCEAILRDGDYDIAISEGTFQYVVYYNGSSNTGWVNTGREPLANAWIHVAITRSGTSLVFYLNGVSVYTQTLPSSVASSYTGFPFRVGYAGYGTTFFDGQIDEVKLWNTARTASEIAGNMHSAPSLTDAALLAYYDFNTGYGSKVLNLKNGAAETSNLTTANSPTWDDVKSSSTSGNTTTITFPRSYINFAGGWRSTSGSSQFQYLIVAGGGGGGNGHDNGGGGGGGGGMVRTGNTWSPSNVTNIVTVGAGGIGGKNTRTSVNGSNGGDSVFSSITSLGGGYGLGSRSAPGGSGVGGNAQISTASAATGGNGGGAGGGGGGGGGSAGAGGNRSGATGGTSGAGLSNSLSGTSKTYGSGGSGANGSVDFNGTAGATNTGNGGGGGGGTSSSSRAGANGGSGIIIIQFSVGGSTLSISFSGGSQAIYNTAGVITATASGGGYVTFYVLGKAIPGCKNKLLDASNIATCSWKPAIRGNVSITVVSMPAKNSYQLSSSKLEVFVARRTGAR